LNGGEGDESGTLDDSNRGDLRESRRMKQLGGIWPAARLKGLLKTQKGGERDKRHSKRHQIENRLDPNGGVRGLVSRRSTLNAIPILNLWLGLTPTPTGEWNRLRRPNKCLGKGASANDRSTLKGVRVNAQGA